jgi:hypothetical protein
VTGAKPKWRSTGEIRAATDFDGTERAPMRSAEARITLGVVAARQGDVEEAVSQGRSRKCVSRPHGDMAQVGS